MSGKDVAIPIIIVLLIVLLLAGGVGYLLLRGGDDTNGMGRVAERAVEEGMADNRVNVEGELFSCPKCGGEGGFHVGFRKGTGMRERTLEVILVCPHCGFRFAVGGGYSYPRATRAHSIPRSTPGPDVPLRPHPCIHLRYGVDKSRGAGQDASGKLQRQRMG